VLPPDSPVPRVAGAIAAAGGRALVVGGWVRDRLLGLPSRDVDLEVYGLDVDPLESLLGAFGTVRRVGRAFPVLLVQGLGLQVSLPRRDSAPSEARGSLDAVDPALDLASASRRRDLTINSIAWDPLADRLHDPHGGLRDLERRVLRATDERHFGEDPLRGLRVAQLAARFEMQPDTRLRALCRALDLSGVAPERQLEEFRKLLLLPKRPSLGLSLLHDTGLLDHYPELLALVGVPQDPLWHPEGEVWRHTLMVVDEAAMLRVGDDAEDAVLLFAALCHDLGKPATTIEEGGRIRSPRHDVVGAKIAEHLLARLRAPGHLCSAVSVLVRYHLAPALYVREGARPRGYRRLARRLGAAGVSPELLRRVARADHLGRTTEEAIARRFPAGDEFLAQIRALEIDTTPPRDAVLGRHVLARGVPPGPEVGRILARCRELQDESGWTDPEQILSHILEAHE